MVPSYDPALNLIYIGTSVPSPAPKFMMEFVGACPTHPKNDAVSCRFIPRNLIGKQVVKRLGEPTDNLHECAIFPDEQVHSFGSQNWT